MAGASCPVCLSEEVLRPVLLDGCEHRFCRDCILRWSRVTNLCPVCRRAFGCISSVARPSKVIRVAERRQQVRFEDTGLALADPFPQPSPRRPLARQNGFRIRDPPGDGYSSLLGEWGDPSERGVAAYQRLSLQTRLLESVYGRINGERDGRRRRQRRLPPTEQRPVGLSRPAERPRRRRSSVVVLSDSEEEGADSARLRRSEPDFHLEYAVAQSP